LAALFAKIGSFLTAGLSARICRQRPPDVAASLRGRAVDVAADAADDAALRRLPNGRRSDIKAEATARALDKRDNLAISTSVRAFIPSLAPRAALRAAGATSGF